MGYAELVAAADRAAMSLLGGEPVTYAPGTGALPLRLPAPLGLQPVVVTGIYDSQFVLANGDAQAGVEAGRPAVFFRLSDLPTDPTDDTGATLTIRGQVHRVTERNPDGMGGIVLFVRRIT